MQPLHQLGQVFWRGVSWLMPPGSAYEDAGRFIIDRYVLVHAKDWSCKFEILLLMFRKLRLLRAGKIPVRHRSVVCVCPPRWVTLVARSFCARACGRLRMLCTLYQFKYFNSSNLCFYGLAVFTQVVVKVLGNLATLMCIRFFPFRTSVGIISTDILSCNAWTCFLCSLKA